MSRTRSERLEPGAWKIIAVAILGPFMSNMDSTVVNVSLSFIKQGLRSTIASAQWVVSGYLLALAIMRRSTRGWWPSSTEETYMRTPPKRVRDMLSSSGVSLRPQRPSGR
jgi:hypothetical protein